MFQNNNLLMYELRNTTVNKFGKDQTGLISYKFDEYGFREGNDYKNNPYITFFGVSLLYGIGVNTQEKFSNYFENCWNFGLAGKYTEEEIIQNYHDFKKLQIDTKIVFVWRNNTYKKYLNDLNDNNILHCIPERINMPNCIRLMKPIDYDVSNTHWGPETHNKFYKLLCYTLKL